jgi:hypothetical protein
LRRTFARRCDAFEPRAKITSLNVVTPEDEQRYDITLTMTLVNLPDPVTLTSVPQSLAVTAHARTAESNPDR